MNTPSNHNTTTTTTAGKDETKNGDSSRASKKAQVRDTAVKIGASWAAFGLNVGKTALKGSAKTLESAAKALESIAGSLQSKETKAKEEAKEPAPAPKS